MRCKVCGENTITPVGTCANIDCKGNTDRELTSIDILEKFINDGTPPDTVAMEHDNKGVIRTVFRWDSGTFLHLRYSLILYAYTLSRFMDFWGTCLPQTKPTITKKEEGEGGEEHVGV